MRRALVLLGLTAVLGCDGTAGVSDRSTDAGKQGEEAVSAEDVLRQMADYVQGLESYQFDAMAVTKLKSGEFEFGVESEYELKVQSPRRLAMRMKEGQSGLTIITICDGKQLFTYWPEIGKYTVREAPRDLADVLSAGHTDDVSGVAGQLIAALLSDDIYAKMMEGVTGTEYLGAEDVDGVECHHCKLFQKQVDWDLWIAKEGKPLIRKIVPDVQNQFAEISEQLEGAGFAGIMKNMKMDISVAFADWNVDADFADDDFTFTPPEGAEKVEGSFDPLRGLGGRR